jgi:hypothetical protein
MILQTLKSCKTCRLPPTGASSDALAQAPAGHATLSITASAISVTEPCSTGPLPAPPRPPLLGGPVAPPPDAGPAAAAVGAGALAAADAGQAPQARGGAAALCLAGGQSGDLSTVTGLAAALAGHLSSLQLLPDLPATPLTEAEPSVQAAEAEPSVQATEAEPSAQAAEAEPSVQATEAEPSAQAAEAGPSAQTAATACEATPSQEGSGQMQTRQPAAAQPISAAQADNAAPPKSIGSPGAQHTPGAQHVSPSTAAQSARAAAAGPAPGLLGQVQVQGAELRPQIVAELQVSWGFRVFREFSNPRRHDHNKP